ncbi:hypothetical protein BTEBP_150069 [Brochothrix thermosphacta]|nr:hypothetical protein BTEBP_150069 [Brochothrix thermosphacta]
MDCRLSSTILFCIGLIIEPEKNAIFEISEITVTKRNTFNFIVDTL